MSGIRHLPAWINHIAGSRVPVLPSGIYLTFDDGPDPESTPWLLQELKNFKARATFFCSGRQAESSPLLYRQILEEGHETGNHGYNHLNGWFISRRKYLSDIERASLYIDSKLFRPPFGKIAPAQWFALRKRFSIVLWDLLFEDYHPAFEPFLAFQQAKKHLRPGKIIVLHDSVSSAKNTKVLLPLILEYLKRNEIATYTFSNHQIKSC